MKFPRVSVASSANCFCVVTIQALRRLPLMTVRKGIQMRCLSCLGLALTLCTLLLAQNPPETSPSSLPKLERFSPDQGDKASDPCNDFFQYASGKWIKANPIPPDQ